MKKIAYSNVSRLALAFALGLAPSLPGFCAESAAEPAKKSKPAATAILKVDPAASALKWTGRKVTGQHNGTVKLKGGEIILTGGALTGGAVEIDMASIQNEDLKDPAYNAKLVGHLKSADFFDAEKFPVATFKITGVKPAAVKKKDGPTHEIAGDLTIKGNTQPVSIPAVVRIENGRAEAKGKVALDRTLWGIRYGSGQFFQNLGDKMIDDNFNLDLHVVAAKN